MEGKEQAAEGPIDLTAEIQFRLKARQRRIIAQLFMAALAAFIPIVLFSFISPFYRVFPDQELIVFLAITLAATGIVVLLLRYYLNGSFDEEASRRDVIAEIMFDTRSSKTDPSLSDELKKLKADVLRLNEILANVNPDIKKSVIDKIKELSTEELIVDIERRIEEKYANTPNTAFISLDERKHELLREIGSLNRRSNNNLAIGSGVALLGVGMLGYFVIYATDQSIDLRATIFYFVPRVTLVLFVQTFAYFFLRLYRNDLEQIKLYNDQITHLARIKSSIMNAFASNIDHLKEVTVTKLSESPTSITQTRRIQRKIENNDIAAINSVNELVKTISGSILSKT